MGSLRRRQWKPVDTISACHSRESACGRERGGRRKVARRLGPLAAAIAICAAATMLPHYRSSIGFQSTSSPAMQGLTQYSPKSTAVPIAGSCRRRTIALPSHLCVLAQRLLHADLRAASPAGKLQSPQLQASDSQVRPCPPPFRPWNLSCFCGSWQTPTGHRQPGRYPVCACESRPCAYLAARGLPAFLTSPQAPGAPRSLLHRRRRATWLPGPDLDETPSPPALPRASCPLQSRGSRPRGSNSNPRAPLPSPLLPPLPLAQPTQRAASLVTSTTARRVDGVPWPPLPRSNPQHLAILLPLPPRPLSSSTIPVNMFVHMPCPTVGEAVPNVDDGAGAAPDV